MKLPELCGYRREQTYSEGGKTCILWQDRTANEDALRKTARSLCSAETAHRQENCGKRNEFGRNVQKNGALCES